MADISREELLKQNELLNQRIDELESTVIDLKKAIEMTSSKSGNVIERLGKVLGEEMNFVKDLMAEDIDQAKIYADTLKTNFVDLTQRVGETTKNMFIRVQDYFDKNIPVPFKKVYDFIEKQFDAENDAHFFDFDNKMLVAKERAVLEIAKLKGKIADVKEYLSDEKASWVSTFKHEGWKLAEKLGFHEQKNIDLVKKLEESTRAFGKSIVAINEVIRESSKEKSQATVEWLQTNLINTVEKTQNRIEKALSTAKSVSRSFYTLEPKEFFKSALEGVEKAVALKEGYKIDGKGELYVPTLPELAVDKYKELLMPFENKFKIISDKASTLIKKEGAYDKLGTETKFMTSRSLILGLEDVPNTVSFRDISRGEVEVLTDKTDNLEKEISKAVDLTALGGHNNEETLNNISRDMTDVRETFDKTVGESYLTAMNNILIENEIILSVENDLELKPALMENTDACEQYLLNKVSKVNTELVTARVDFSYFYSGKSESYIVKEDITSKTGETVSLLYDTNDLNTPIRINTQKEINGDIKTVFDKESKLYMVSAINNGMTGKVLHVMPDVKESIEKTVRTEEKDIDKTVEKDEVIKA